MGVKVGVAYPYFIREVSDSRAKGGNVGLEMLDLRADWVIV